MDQDLPAKPADAEPEADVAVASSRTTMIIIVCFVLGLVLLLAFNMN